MAEVIDILSDDDDDDIIQVNSPITPKKKKFKCLNADCQSEKDLIKATMAVRRYYGVLMFPKKTKVCARCSAYAKIKGEAIIDSVRTGNLLFNITGPENKNTVVLTDSESDLTDNECDSEESLFEIDTSEIYNVNNDEGTDSSYENIKSLLSTITDELGLKKQVEEGAKKVNARLTAAEEGFKSLNDEYKTIENNIDKLRNNFYDTFKLDIKWLPCLEIGPQSLLSNNADVTEVISESPILQHQKLNLPPIGQLVKPDLQPNDLTYSIKYSLFAKWVQATVISQDCDSANSKMYTICYSRNINQPTGKRTVSARNLAYYNPCPTRIPVGTRIVAKYREEGHKSYSSGFYFVGIVAEIPTVANKYRYLIFFDDGYAQYVNHQDIRVVVESSLYPWEDVASDSREFIKDYLHTYPERPMVRLQRTNFIKTEWNGRWWKAQVLEVDASLVKMYFPVDGRTEWIYRGSTRLSPLFNKKLNIQSQIEQPKVIRRRTLPFSRSGPVVEYVNFGQGKENEEVSPDSPKLSEPQMPAPSSTATVERRAVARKSTSGRPGTPPLEVQEQIFQESRGFVKRKILKGALVKFSPHQCSRKCILINHYNEICSPLLKPMLEGWRRLIIKEKKKTISRNSVAYVAPCGRRLRSIEEVFRYLRITESDLEIDFFTFDLGVEPANDWEPAKKNFFISDISNGVEQMPVSCVNSLDKSNPQPLIYCNVRLPTENVNLNLDPAFLVCCSCTDDCQNKSLCECWQLTIEAGQLVSGRSQNLDIGYKFRRLHEQVATGIFECNDLCSCKKTCLNKVVQFPIRQKLQLFKTARRGWGVRTLHDIPQGAFICVYVGKVLSEAVANQEGKLTTGGDDYYAELDFIEVVDGMKEGYESDAEEGDNSFEGQQGAKNSDSNSDIESSTEDVEPEKGIEVPLFRGSYDMDEDFCISSKSTLQKQNIKQRKPSARIKARSVHSEPNSNDVSSRSRSNSPDTNMEDDSEKQREDEQDDDEGEDMPVRQPQTFEPLQTTAPPISQQYRTLRELFGEDEAVYIMDAKVTGNIGRYFNHSCQPNVFVQNVFVDTHDLRFPWVSFFASVRIRAGVELTWDYNYEVGSVPGKIKYCYCMAKKCRGRLL